MTDLTNEELIALEKAAMARVEAGLAAKRYTFRAGTHGNEAVCDLYVFLFKPDRTAAVVLSERPDNPGRSVTNAIEQLACEVYSRYLSDTVTPGRVAWVQHDELLSANKRGYERVRLSWEEHGGAIRFHSPRWMTLRPSAVAEGAA